MLCPVVSCCVLLCPVHLSVDCTQARSIKQLGWGGDGREAYINSRIFNMRPSRGSPTSRNALTDEAAETSANSQPGGIHRLFAPRSRRTYATVNPDNIEWNTLKAGVQTRARSAQVGCEGLTTRQGDLFSEFCLIEPWIGSTTAEQPQPALIWVGSQRCD